VKKIILIIIAIIIVWFGVRFFIGGSEDAPRDDRVLTPFIETSKTNEKNNDKRYEIDIELPVIKDVDNSEKVNAFIKGKVDEIVNKFKDNIDEWDVPSDFDSEMKSGLWINFEKHLLTESHISLRITISEYFIGAAHPNNYSFSLNYNLDKSGEITLDKFFNVSQEEYLSRISDLALIDLVKQSENLDISLDPGMLESGTEPKLENFSNFNLTESGVAFNFDQYQIAPYAAGEFHVIIPYEEISDIMEKSE